MIHDRPTLRDENSLTSQQQSNATFDPEQEFMWYLYKRKQKFRRFWIAFIGFILIAIGFGLIILQNFHIFRAEITCDSPNNNLLLSNPELYAWKYCKFKVYPYRLIA